MSFYRPDIEFAVERYKERVEEGERRALLLAHFEPLVPRSSKLLHKAARWLGRQRESLIRDIVPGALAAHGEHTTG